MKEWGEMKAAKKSLLLGGKESLNREANIVQTTLDGKLRKQMRVGTSQCPLPKKENESRQEASEASSPVTTGNRHKTKEEYAW